MMRWHWDTALWVGLGGLVALMLVVCTQGTRPALAAPPLPDDLQAELRAYLVTEARFSAQADAIRAELAPALERAGYRPAHWLELVRQVFPLAAPSPDAMARPFLTRDGRAPKAGHYPIYLPKAYTPDVSWPLHVVLHGGGGHDGFRCRDYWPSALRKELPWILICPSTPEGRFHMWNGEAAFLDALHHAIRTYNIDPERISLGGLSTGATAAWTLSARHPGRWRALVSRAGGPILAPLNPRAPAYTNLKRLPALVLHGAQDDIIHVSTARLRRCEQKYQSSVMRKARVLGITHPHQKPTVRPSMRR
ncbi:MAG: hypothetical protein AAFX99_18975 [Myxococcota bacterium]